MVGASLRGRGRRGSCGGWGGTRLNAHGVELWCLFFGLQSRVLCGKDDLCRNPTHFSTPRTELQRIVPCCRDGSENAIARCKDCAESVCTVLQEFHDRGEQGDACASHSAHKASKGSFTGSVSRHQFPAKYLWIQASMGFVTNT